MILVFVTFLSILTVSESETNVFCVFFERCVLPCHFQGGDEVVIQYSYLDDIRVHSFYQNQDHLDSQDLRFRNRTSLFKDEISTGKASLLLIDVTSRDEGQYVCSVSTITGKESSIINLRVDAPVTKVSITPEGDRLTCSSYGIYPEPELTWSITSPLNTTHLVRYKTQPTDLYHYSISSSVTVSDSFPDLIYNCTIRTRSNQRTAVVRQQTTSGRSKTIPCVESNITGMQLVWRLSHNQMIQARPEGDTSYYLLEEMSLSGQMILTRPEGDASYHVSEKWRKHVTGVSESGGLTLQDLSPEQAGVYSCEVGNDYEKPIINHFLLRVTPEKPSVIGSIVVGVAAVVLIAAAAVLLGLCCKKIKRKDSHRDRVTSLSGKDPAGRKRPTRAGL